MIDHTDPLLLLNDASYLQLSPVMLPGRLEAAQVRMPQDQTFLATKF